MSVDALGRDYGSAPCGTCGLEFERTNAGSRYCSENCKPSRMQRRLCAYCAVPFSARRAPARTRRKFGDQFTRCCSKSCALRLGAMERNPTCPWSPPECQWCGRLTGSRHRPHCSDACYDIDTGRRPHVTPLEYGNCRECGGLFVGKKGWGKTYCSVACAARSAKRTRRHRERAAGLTTSPPFTLREVAERDGWRCHLCGKAVPDRPSKARPLDPTIDHLIPLSADGRHTLDNVALAHFRCNWQRGTTGPAQLRLAG